MVIIWMCVTAVVTLGVIVRVTVTPHYPHTCLLLMWYLIQSERNKSQLQTELLYSAKFDKGPEQAVQKKFLTIKPPNGE